MTVQDSDAVVTFKKASSGQEPPVRLLQGNKTQMADPHGIALDSRGDIYLGEVGVTNWKTSFPDTPMPPVVRSLQKLERVSAAASS